MNPYIRNLLPALPPWLPQLLIERLVKMFGAQNLPMDKRYDTGYWHEEVFYYMTPAEHEALNELAERARASNAGRQDKLPSKTAKVGAVCIPQVLWICHSSVS